MRRTAAAAVWPSVVHAFACAGYLKRCTCCCCAWQEADGSRRLVAFNAAERGGDNRINLFEYDEGMRLLHRWACCAWPALCYRWCWCW